MDNSKDIIMDLFFFKHLKVKEIAKELNCSSAYITKITKQDDRYIAEKQFRKNISKKNRKIAQNNSVKKKRDLKRNEDNYLIVKAQHEQATKELSKSRHLSDENYRQWNISAYHYNPSKNRYEFDKQLGRSADIPKYIKER